MAGAEPSTQPPLAFGDFVLDIANARLTRNGQVLELPPKSFALLADLARRPGELVRKDDLLDRVWGRRYVSDSAVKTVLSELRAALCDDARTPRWIETVQAQGYRFLGAVQPLTGDRAAAPPPGSAPLKLPRMQGRDDDLSRLAALVDAGPLVTLTGTAGVGKSLLACTLAAQRRSAYADGAWRIELASLAVDVDASTLRESIAQGLALAEAAARDDAALAQALAGLSLLVVLDNAEHLLARLAPLLQRLLEQAPGLHVLVTSREPLHLRQEQLARLDPLATPGIDDGDVQRILSSAAVQLFAERVAARLPGFAVEPAQASALARIVRALDGLPLAIELAAARVPALGVQGLAEQLAREEQPGAESAVRLQLLRQGERATAPRHRTLRDAIAWSHALLAPGEQQVLRRLALFRGGFTLAAAQALAGDEALDEWAVLDAVQGLVDKSLLAASGDEPRRFTMLQSVRAFGAERLADAGETAAMLQRHFAAMLGYWREADSRALGDPALQWVRRHAGSIDDLRAALAWALARLRENSDAALAADLLALVGHSALLWHRAGHAGEGVRWCEQALRCAGADLPAAAQAGVALAQAHLAGIAMVLPAVQGLAAARSAAQVFREQRDVVRECYALYLEHTLMCRAEPAADRAACLARMRWLVQPQWSDLLLRFERSAQAYDARLQGRADEYLRFAEQELQRCRAAGAQWEAWSAAFAVVLAEHDRGNVARALQVGSELIDEMRGAGRLRQNANRLAIWTMMLAQSGDVAGTRRTLVEALPVLQGAGRRGMADLTLAWLAWHEGRAEAAALLLARFDAPHRTGGEFGPGTYIRRSMDALCECVREALGAAALAERREEADALSDAAALEAALGGDTINSGASARERILAAHEGRGRTPIDGAVRHGSAAANTDDGRLPAVGKPTGNAQ